RIYDIFKVYIGNTANLDEGFADIAHLLNEVAEPDRTAIIRDQLRPFALEADLKRAPPSAGQSLGIAMILVIRLWAAIGRADELPAHIFDYVRSADRKWSPFWATVLHEMRFSVDQYRSRFSESVIAAVAEGCQLIQQGNPEQSLKDAAEA